MAEEYKYPKLTLKIISQKGTCAFQHQVGQEFDVSSATTNGICPSAYNAAWPSIFALMLGGQMPWEEDKEVAHVACPDPNNPVVMQIRRTKV